MSAWNTSAGDRHRHIKNSHDRVCLRPVVCRRGRGPELVHNIGFACGNLSELQKVASGLITSWRGLQYITNLVMKLHLKINWRQVDPKIQRNEALRARNGQARPSQKLEREGNQITHFCKTPSWVGDNDLWWTRRNWVLRWTQGRHLH